MKIIKILSAFFYCYLVSTHANGQNLIKCKLANEDKENNVHSTYEYNSSDSYGVIKLCLYKDSTFYYSISSFMRDVFSQGKWVQKKDTLVLNSSIIEDDIPVKLDYSNDTSGLINGFKIGIVKNLKGNEMSDGLVAINNDSNICLPSYGGICRSEYTSIDSIKIVFENGMKSKWMRITEQGYKKIVPVVQVPFLISSYYPIFNEKYLITKASLNPIQ